jgi:hypothetical protein
VFALCIRGVVSGGDQQNKSNARFPKCDSLNSDSKGIFLGNQNLDCHNTHTHTHTHTHIYIFIYLFKFISFVTNSQYMFLNRCDI